MTDQTQIEQIKTLMAVASSQVYKQLVSVEHAGTGALVLRWAGVISALQPATNTRLTSDEWTFRLNRLLHDTLPHLPRANSIIFQIHYLNRVLRMACVARKTRANTEG